MNSQDYRNLQEAYVNVYDSDLREEQKFESWIAGLLDEGYDLSDYNWDEMYEIYNEAYKGGPEFGMKYSKSKPLSGEKGDGSGYGPPEKFTKPDDKIEKPGTTVPPFKKGGYGRIMSNIPHGIGAHRDKIASKITTTTGGDPGAPTSQKMRVPDKKKNLEIIRKKANEAIDLYDVILAHLINEGYADTYEAAESIMVNMSEEWRDDILNEAVYGGEPKKPEGPKDTRLVVTNADKKGNTPAYQNFKKGDKRYRAADHMDEATAMAKRGLDEPAIRNKIASQTRGGEFADKATKLADRETYGNKEMKAGREKLARKQRGTFRDTNSSSPGLRGYGHQSSDPAVKAKQDARGNQRARAALTPNERKQYN